MGKNERLQNHWQTPNGQVPTSISANFTSSTSEWAYVWKQVLAPPDATALRVSIEAGPGTGEVIIDEVEIWGR